jgi:hypothetical protein
MESFLILEVFAGSRAYSSEFAVEGLRRYRTIGRVASAAYSFCLDGLGCVPLYDVAHSMDVFSFQEGSTI